MSQNRLKRSIYRFCNFPNFCPQAIIDLEKEILKESIDQLSLQEIKQAFSDPPNHEETNLA